ncbi:MAG: segregation/condensation protein A [Oscillospiraceae bacterium]|nr:segregation/condensation protein A [Oscillospiraceae bacterium]
MENPSFYLEGIVRGKDSLQDFEGPLNLILMLLQKNKIEIRDLSISDILDQYLEYLNRMQSMDLEIASEFVQMASYLLYLKTQTLLSTEEETSELELLLQSLEQMQAKDRFSALQKLIPALKKASETGLLFLTKPPEPLRPLKKGYEYHHEPVDLLKAMLAIRTRTDALTPDNEKRLYSAMPQRIVYSVRDKGREILELLRGGPQALSSLYGRCSSGSELVATFIAVLELCSAGSLHMQQTEGQLILSFSGDERDLGNQLDRIEENYE